MSDLEWVLVRLLGDGGDELSEELTTKALKRGDLPAVLWSMPVSHLIFTYFKSRDDDPVDVDEMTRFAELNAGQAKPTIPLRMLNAYAR